MNAPKTLAETILEFDDPGPYVEVEAFALHPAFDLDDPVTDRGAMRAESGVAEDHDLLTD